MVYMYVYTHTHILLLTPIYTCIHTHTQTYIHTRAHACSLTHIHVCTRTCSLTHTSGSDRGLGSGQVQPSLSIHPQRVQPGVQVHHWCGVCHTKHHCRQQDHQGSDMGHRYGRPYQLEACPRCVLIPSSKHSETLTLFALMEPF